MMSVTHLALASSPIVHVDQLILERNSIGADAVRFCIGVV